MNFLLAPKKEKDDKSLRHVSCPYCRKYFKDQCALRVHCRVNHDDEIKLESSKRALSRSGSSFNNQPTVLALPCKPIGRSARARITGRTFFLKGWSSSDVSEPPTYGGSAIEKSSGVPENHQDPAETMPFAFQSPSSGCSSSGRISHPCPFSSASFAASPSHLGAAGGHFHGESSSSSQSPILTECFPGNSSYSNHGMPSFRSVNLPNPPAYSPGNLHRLAPTVAEPCPGCGPNHLSRSPPLGLHQSLGPGQSKVGLSLMRRPTHHNYNQGQNTMRASTSMTSNRLGSLDRLMTSCSDIPPKPDGSHPTQELALTLGGPGISYASGEKSGRGDIDLSLHL